MKKIIVTALLTLSAQTVMADCQGPYEVMIVTEDNGAELDACFKSKVIRRNINDLDSAIRLADDVYRTQQAFPIRAQRSSIASKHCKPNFSNPTSLFVKRVAVYGPYCTAYSAGYFDIRNIFFDN